MPDTVIELAGWVVATKDSQGYPFVVIDKAAAQVPVFAGGFAPSIDVGRVLWMDYDSAASIHPTATGVPAERRVERLASPSPDDNRISHGCINVSSDFYERIISPAFERGRDGDPHQLHA